MQKIIPFLWFDSQAEEAANRYVTLFSRVRPSGVSKILGISRYGEAGPGVPGSVMTVSFMLDGVEFTALNGGPEFSFTEAVSFSVSCETQDEVDQFWDALCEGGEPGPCGWLKDRYGLSWQIVPSVLEELIGDPDPEKARRAMKAMLASGKFDIEELKRAHAGR